MIKFHITHKTELAISWSQNISLYKQIALAITFGQVTAVLKDFFHLWSCDLDRLIYRESDLFLRFIFFLLIKPYEIWATDACTYAISYEDFGKIRV